MKIEKLRNPEEVLLRDGKTLKQALELHNKWLKDEEGGKKLSIKAEDLRYVDLSCLDLRYVDLSFSDLMYADLSFSDLSKTNLSNSNLRCTDLRYSNLSNADLIYANLSNAKFYLTNLYKTKGEFVGIENVGSRNDTTHYFYNDNRTLCWGNM